MTSPPAPDVEDYLPTCEHTVQAFDEAGKMQGTWVIRQKKQKGQPTRRVVICSVCRRFYGYLAVSTSRKG